eukprot:TRINITY_DN95360_c0_g1_i1.p1 TRINITY_DN95360_c0_g1~~TRINITY_DN95360_c0_g1_i1.p1  ORF type:complete len:373 (-),score=148.00 TRINITY_DN95360_c0_g1_i1:52-1131(-)
MATRVLEFLTHRDLLALSRCSRTLQSSCAGSLSSTASSAGAVSLSGLERLLVESKVEENAVFRHVDLTSSAVSVAQLARLTSDAFPYRAVAESLTLQFCKELKNYHLAMLRWLPNLRHVDIGGCHGLTDKAITHILDACPNLTSIRLYWCPQLTDDAMLAIARSQQAPRMQSINLSGVRHISNAAVAALAKACPNVHTLDLTRVEALATEGMTAIGKHMPLLRDLRMYACAELTNAGLEAIARGCPLLQAIDITGAKLISDEAVVALARHCPQLNWLSTMWCVSLGTEFVTRGLAVHARRLEWLSVHGNTKLTDAHLEALGRTCAQLRMLDVHGCSGIQDRSLERMRRVFPNFGGFVEL